MRKSYRFRDGSLVFAGTLLSNIAVLFLMSTILYLFSTYLYYSSSELYSNMWIIYLNSFLCELGFFLLFLIYNKKQKIDFCEASRIKVKFDKKIAFAVAGLAILVFFASLNFTGLFNSWASSISPLSLNASVPLNNVWQLLLSILFFAFIPAICEELVFRGVVYNSLRRKFGARLSIIISAVAFMIIHFSIYQTMHQLIIGIVLGCLVYFTGSIVYGIIYHFVNNLTVLLLTYFSSVGAFFSFSNFGLLEVMFTVLIFVIGIVATGFFFFYLSRYTKKHRNYLDLEKNSQKIESNDKDENAEAVRTRNHDIAYMVLTMVVCIVLWFFNSFGG